MQLVNCLVALGGDMRNTVPKARITVAEVALLQAIHGADAVHEIEPLDEDIRVRPRAEVERLAEIYPAKDADGRLVLQQTFPGNGQGMPENLDDLDLDAALFKVSSRVAAKPGKPRAKASKADDAETLFA